MWSGYLSSEFDKQGHYKDLMDDPNVIFKILHTGGHSASEDLNRFISGLDPESLLPFHTNSQEYISQNPDTFGNINMLNLSECNQELEV